MKSEEPFGDRMPNFNTCGTVFKESFKDIDVLDVDAKTETAASSENSGLKSTENEQCHSRLPLGDFVGHVT